MFHVTGLCVKMTARGKWDENPGTAHLDLSRVWPMTIFSLAMVSGWTGLRCVGNQLCLRFSLNHPHALHPLPG